MDMKPSSMSGEIIAVPMVPHIGIDVPKMSSVSNGAAVCGLPARAAAGGSSPEEIPIENSPTALTTAHTVFCC